MSVSALAAVLDRYPAASKAELRRKAILCAIAAAADERGADAHPGLQVICQRASCDKVTAIRHLNALVEDGWLEVTEPGRGRGNATVFRLGKRLHLEETVPDKRLHSSPKRLHSRPENEGPHVLPIEEKSPQSQQETHLAVVVPMPTGRLLDVPSTVDVVFDAWRKATGRTGRTVLTKQRRRVIEARIAEGYEADDLLAAVRGWKRSPFHCGDNETRTVYNELTLLLRNGENVERFRDMEVNRANVHPVAAVRDPAVEAIMRQREMEGRA